MNILVTFLIISIIMDFLFLNFCMIGHRKDVDAAYQRGVADAKQATTEVINEITIKISEGKSLHDAANEVKRMLKGMQQ